MLTKILYNLCMEKISFKNEVDGFIIDLLQDKGLPYNVCQKALRKQDIKVDGKRIKENIKIDKGTLVEVYYQKTPPKFDIVYQDDDIFVVNKHSGIEVEGKDGVAQSLNAIAVHRLDRNTTGLLCLREMRPLQMLFCKHSKIGQSQKNILPLLLVKVI